MKRHPESRIKRHEAQDNALLGFLRARPREAGEGHRTNPRHEATTRARLAWKAGETHRVAPARMLDIGRAGAALAVSTPPPEGATVLVRLMGAEPTPWIEAQVVGIEPIRASRYRVRLHFLEFCPDVFLKAAVLGDVPAEAQDHRDAADALPRPADFTGPTPVA